MERKLIAAIACRNQGSRLYGKPLQNLDVEKGIKIIDHIIDHLKETNIIDNIVLGIAEGIENEIYKQIVVENSIDYIIGDEQDVLKRLILCGEHKNALIYLELPLNHRLCIISPLMICGIFIKKKN